MFHEDIHQSEYKTVGPVQAYVNVLIGVTGPFGGDFGHLDMYMYKICTNL